MWPKIHLQTKLVFKFYYWSKAKQGQTVHKLQIATFWEIYIHIYPVKRERERERQRKKETEKNNGTREKETENKTRTNCP